MVLPRLKLLAIFGAVVACGVAGAAAWGLLKGGAPAEAQNPPVPPALAPGHIAGGHTAGADGPHADHSSHRRESAATAPGTVTDPHGADAGRASDSHEPAEHDAAHPEESHLAVVGDSHASTSTVPTKEAAERRTLRTTAELVRADGYLRQGDLAMAMKVYGAEIQQSGSNVDPVVYFRWALCAESLGMLDDALTRYQALAENASSPAWRGFALWGQGRVLQQLGRLDLAVRVASEIALTRNESAVYWRPEMVHWVGQVLYQRSIGTSSVDLLIPGTLVECRWKFRTSDLLEICTKIHVTELSGETPISGEFSSEMHPDRQPAARAVQLIQTRGSVAEVIGRVADAAHWRIEFSESAESVAAVRMCRVHSSEKPELLLDCLCDPAGMTWRIENDHIRIQVIEELTAAERLAFQRDVTTRRLRENLATESLHPWASHSQFGLGHLQRLSGDAAGSQAVFRELITSYPQSPLLGETWFNIGQLHVESGDVPLAIDAFQRCVDNAAGTPLEPVADLYLGRMLLEFEDPMKATLALRRAAALASPQMRPHATLALAAAHLAAGHPGQANEVLRVAETYLKDERFRDAAAFLSSLSQVRAARDPWKLKNDQRNLIAALSHVRPEDMFGWQGAALIGAAYFELGLPSEGAAVCKHAVEHMPECPLRSRLRLMLVDDACNRGELAPAEAMLRELISSKEKQTRAGSFRRLCELLLNSNRVDDAQQTALSWLDAVTSPTDQADALRQLGRCLERKGDRLNAALCFAGTRPELKAESDAPAAFPGSPDVGTRLPRLPSQTKEELTGRIAPPSH